MKTLYFNGKIYSSNFPSATALVVQNKIITWIGVDKVGKALHPEITEVDLRGTFVTSSIALPYLFIAGECKQSELNLFTEQLANCGILALGSSKIETLVLESSIKFFPVTELKLISNYTESSLYNYLFDTISSKTRVTFQILDIKELDLFLKVIVKIADSFSNFVIAATKLNLILETSLTKEKIKILANFGVIVNFLVNLSKPLVINLAEVLSGGIKVILLPNFTKIELAEYNPWRLIKKLICYDSQLSVRAALNALTRTPKWVWNYRDYDSDNGLISVASKADLGFWHVENFLSPIASENASAIRRWSLDARGLTPLIPDLLSEKTLPKLAGNMLEGKLNFLNVV